MATFSKKFSNISVVVFVMVILFSMSSWLDVVGVWVEMPLLTAIQPEGWKLPSYIAIIIQLANVGPASYAIIRKIRGVKQNSSASHKIDVEVVVAFAIIAVAGLSVFLMAFLWNKTAFVFGSSRSVALFSLMATTALSSCTSSVVFLPYMARFATPYISAYYVGQGVSGLVPGLIGLIQGIGKYDCIQNFTALHGNQSEYVMDNFTTATINPPMITALYHQPKFAIDVFFICLTILFIVSGVSFYMLNFSQYGVKAMISSKNGSASQKSAEENHVKHADEQMTSSQENHENGTAIKNAPTVMENSASSHLLLSEVQCDQVTDDLNLELCDVGNPEKVEDTIQASVVQPKHLSKATFAALLIIVGSVNALSNGLLPSTQSYTCLPYGFLVYTLALRLSSIAGPVASLSSMVLPRATTKVVFLLALLGTSIAVFHIILAAQSPNPMLRGHIAGEIIVIISSIIMSACFSYVRVSVAMLLHQKGGRRELLWCGGITQVGSFCGAVVAFILVSILHIFSSRKPCT